VSVFPGKGWWLTPSGGPYPNPRSLLTILMEAPLPSHAIGGFLAAAALLPFGLRGFMLWYGALLIMIAHQAINLERLNLHNYPLNQMIWRVLIGVVPLGMFLWLI
jgi:hypothetical protein